MPKICSYINNTCYLIVGYSQYSFFKSASITCVAVREETVYGTKNVKIILAQVSAVIDKFKRSLP